jgi:protoporphyrinogen oxidase
MKKVCIIGAGITGLVTAYRLLSEGYDVTVLECAMIPGGMVSSFSMGWEKIEHIYHHIFTTDTYVKELSQSLGIEDQIKWLESKDAIYVDKKTYPFSSPIDLLKFNAIPIWDRVRTGVAVIKARKKPNFHDLETKTAKEWLIKSSGAKAYDKFWNPLLRSKFDYDAEEISAVWICNKFKLRGNSRGRSSRKELLGYMDGGFGTLVTALTKAITAKGGEILYGYTALNISKESSSSNTKVFNVACVLEDCSTVVIDADSVVTTLSGSRFASMTSDLNIDRKFLEDVNKVRYKCDLCMVLRLKRSLSEYYWTTVCDDLPFVVVVEHTNLASMRKYGGNVIYLSRYIDITDPLWTQSDSDIYKLFCKGLATMYPDFKMSDVKDWRLTRTRGAQPVIERNYSKYMPSIKTPENGLFLAGTAQIYPEDRGMNYAIRLADQTSAAVKDYLSLLSSETDPVKSTVNHGVAEIEFSKGTAVLGAVEIGHSKSTAVPGSVENEFSKGTSTSDNCKEDFKISSITRDSGDKVFTLETAPDMISISEDSHLKSLSLSDSMD